MSVQRATPSTSETTASFPLSVVLAVGACERPARGGLFEDLSGDDQARAAKNAAKFIDELMRLRQTQRMALHPYSE